jgi:hypothetical protein
MNKTKIVKLLAATAMATVLSNAAHSQVTVSGYVETTLMNGGFDNASNSPAGTRSLGSESLIKIASKGKMSNGMGYEAFQELESDETFAFHQRYIGISPSNDVTLFYSFDGAKGSEISGRITPFVTERNQDITGQSGIPEYIDITSSQNFVGLDVMNIGPAGQLSVAFNPNMAGTSNSGSDRLLPATKTQQGYSVGYKVTPVAGLTIGAGLTKIDADRTDFQDANAKTLGFSYASAPFAIGAQRINQEGLKTSQAATQKDEIDIISATYAASKEITVGASYAKNERTLAGVKAADETKSYNVAIAYNLGPVVASLNYENSYDTPASGTVAPINGRDVSITKLKVRANY